MLVCLIRSVAHIRTNLFIKWLHGHTFQTQYLGVCNMDGLRIFQIVKFWCLFAWTSFLHFISLFSRLLSAVGKSQASPSRLCLELSSAQDLIVSLASFYLPRNTRTRTQFSQDLCCFITRISLPPISSSMFLISGWSLIRMAFTIHISVGILFVITKAFSQKTGTFSEVLLSPFWALTRMAFKSPFTIILAPSRHLPTLLATTGSPAPKLRPSSEVFAIAGPHLSVPISVLVSSGCCHKNTCSCLRIAPPENNSGHCQESPGRPQEYLFALDPRG